MTDFGRVTGSREPSPSSSTAGLGPSGFDPARKCECECEGVLKSGFADWYDPELELPFVNHAPGKCRCTNDLAPYRRDGGVVWLCSCCTMFDERLTLDDAIAMEGRDYRLGGEAMTAREQFAENAKCSSPKHKLEKDNG